MKKYQLIKFSSGEFYDDGQDRETLILEDIAPLIVLKAQEIMFGVGNDFVTGYEMLNSWKRFNVLILTPSGLKGKIKYKCIEVMNND